MKSPGATRKAQERERRKAAGEHYLQKWIPKACLPQIEEAIEKILQDYQSTQPNRKDESQ
mgnify:CR=1 FL=1